MSNAVRPYPAPNSALWWAIFVSATLAALVAAFVVGVML